MLCFIYADSIESSCLPTLNSIFLLAVAITVAVVVACTSIKPECLARPGELL